MVAPRFFGVLFLGPRFDAHAGLDLAGRVGHDDVVGRHAAEDLGAFVVHQTDVDVSELGDTVAYDHDLPGAAVAAKKRGARQGHGPGGLVVEDAHLHAEAHAQPRRSVLEFDGQIDALLLDAEGAFISYFPTVTHGLDALPWSNVICQPACFVRREALAKVGGLDTRLHYVMDWDLWLRLRDAGCKFLFLDQVLAAVIAHADTKTNRGGEDRFAEIAACLRARLGARKRLASLLRHRAYGAHKHVGWLVSLGLRGLALLLDPAGRGGGGGVIAGIRVCSGRVSRACRVPMPWYDAEPPRWLVIAAQPAGEYRVRCNGSELSVSREPMGTVLSFELAPAVRRLYDIEIIGARRNWYLKGIRLLRRVNDHGSKPNPD